MGGGRVRPVNIRWSGPEVAFSPRDCGARILLADDSFAPLVELLRGDGSCPETVLHTGPDPVPAEVLAAEALIAGAHVRPGAQYLHSAPTFHIADALSWVAVNAPLDGSVGTTPHRELAEAVWSSPVRRRAVWVMTC
jgi:hypothetical protein